MKTGLIVLFSVVFFMVSSLHADVLIITNKNVTEKSLSSKDINQIFLGKKKRWQDNTFIYFAISDNRALHEAFLDKYIHRSPKQFRAYWKNMVFSGKGQFPKSFKMEKELIKYVTDTNGAIGYIDAKTTTTADVNIISVE